jgi:hypothetical protein
LIDRRAETEVSDPNYTIHPPYAQIMDIAVNQNLIASPILCAMPVKVELVKDKSHQIIDVTPR